MARHAIFAAKIRRLETPHWLMLGVGAALMARGVWPLWSSPRGHFLADLLLIFVSAVLGFVLLLILDYTLHHAFIVFCGLVIFLICLFWLHPNFAAGMGVALIFLVLSEG